MKLKWSPLAVQRAAEAATRIAQDKPGAATKWLGLLFDRVERLGKFPESGRMIPEVGDPRYREVLYGNYRVLYRITSSLVEILTIRHVRRQLDFAELSDEARTD